MTKTEEEKKVKKPKINKDKEKIKELEDQLLRSKAEFINFKKRIEGETVKLLKYSDAEIVASLLPVIDDFERALKMDDTHSEEIIKYKEGVAIIHDKLVNILKNFSVTEIDALDKEFDPEFHQGVVIEEDKTKAPNVVLEVMQKGYMLKDKVIRPAMVKINKGEDKHE